MLRQLQRQQLHWSLPQWLCTLPPLVPELGTGHIRQRLLLPQLAKEAPVPLEQLVEQQPPLPRELTDNRKQRLQQQR